MKILRGARDKFKKGDILKLTIIGDSRNDSYYLQVTEATNNIGNQYLNLVDSHGFTYRGVHTKHFSFCMVNLTELECILYGFEIA